LLHCMLADGRTWRPLVQALPPAHTIAFDLHGRGRTGDWDGAEYRTQCVDIVIGLLEKPAHVIGHSFRDRGLVAVLGPP